MLDGALAFGVPPMLLGIPGDNTYANYAEANRAFWCGTVLPLTARIAGALGSWLALAFGDPDRSPGQVACGSDWPVEWVDNFGRLPFRKRRAHHPDARRQAR